LRKATAGRTDADALFQEGVQILAAHRKNYGPAGPQYLEVLWWEWPPLHWEELREGGSMNFMAEPREGLLPNSDMTEEQLATAVQFVEELIALGVYERVPPGSTLRNNCPLFLVPKPGQPGQWRCIANMKDGGQNEVCVGDPVHLSQPQDILPHLYPGGYSTVIDASKFFHMFRTRAAERKYMGMLHPSTGEHWWHTRFPMGSTNSPGASGRYGAGFLRFIREHCPLFQGHPRLNSMLSGGGFDPALGEGRVLVDDDGSPALLIWIHVDDVFLHGPDGGKVEAGLNYVMDTALRLGLICQPVKTKPPGRVQKFCGMLYDSRATPCMRIPVGKIERAIALLDYLDDVVGRRLARLTLSVVTGVLQSLVPATPGNIGATFLVNLYEDQNRYPVEKGRHRADFYYDPVALSTSSRAELAWWRAALDSGLCRWAQTRDVGTLVCTFGDGSGTGTGGTFELVEVGARSQARMEMWMGTWSLRVHSFTSNWKELCTLRQVLRRELARDGGRRLRGRRLFYFTDNTVSYDIVRKGRSGSGPLQELVREIKLLELQLDCRVEAVHVPGTTMIVQGTDGLSRGLWMERLNQAAHDLPRALFRPAPCTPAILAWCLEQVHSVSSPADWRFEADLTAWQGSDLIGHRTLWCLSPLVARQGFSAAAHAWVESPLDSEHLFLVPRVLQRDFGRVNKHILFIGQFSDVPLNGAFSPLVPFVLFYLPRFRRELGPSGDTGMEPSPAPFAPRWVHHQVAHVRGLSPAE